jgi:hypothetical protein
LKGLSMALFLRTFPTQPKLQNRMYGEGREFLQRANLVESETSRAGFVFEFRFNESDGHLPPRSFVPLRLDSFSILREKRKLSDAGSSNAYTSALILGRISRLWGTRKVPRNSVLRPGRTK